jgi:hypothetical protein
MANVTVSAATAAAVPAAPAGAFTVARYATGGSRATGAGA